MRVEQKSAWAVVGTLAVAYVGYGIALAGRVRGAGVGAAEYTDLAVGAAVAVVVLLTAVHIAFAVVARPDGRASAAPASRTAAATILAAGAVLAIVLMLAGAAAFWTVNVLITALVAGEIATAAARITAERAAVEHA